MVEKEKVSTSVSFRWEILKKCDEIVEKGLIPGINNRSALIEYAVDRVVKEVFKEASIAARQTCQ